VCKLDGDHQKENQVLLCPKSKSLRGYERVTQRAALDESGRPNDIYDAIRHTSGSYIGADSIALVPADKPLTQIPSIKLTPYVGLFDSLPKPVRMQYLVNMEALGQSTVFTLY
jgi:hypothetical protein